MENLLNSAETNIRQLTPEQKLWRAVFMQAIQDTFGICTVAMSRDEHRESKWWGKVFNQDFADVCEFAGFDPKQTFEKLKRYHLIKSGIVWNYMKNGKRKFADVVVQ